MRRSLVVLLVLAAWPSIATAAPVLVRARNGSVSARNDPFVTGPALTPAPASPSAAPESGTVTSAIAAAHRSRQGLTVLGELTRLYRQHAISASAYHGYEASFRGALATERQLRGTRRAELTAITENLHQIAAYGELNASRLPVLFQTLDRNRQWWTSGPLLSNGQRVEFAGSQLVWEYYAGQGIELQVLGSFAKADALYTAGRSQYPALAQLLSQLIPLGAQRGGGLTWEYYFRFDGASPPWTSAMSQATGLEALSRAYLATGNPYYLGVAHQALPVLTTRPPAGVQLPTSLGVRFLQYTFAPGDSIINAFLQTLIGLHAYAQASGNRQAARLFAEGNAEAQAEVPHFDTGAWSLYQPGIEDSLAYHELVTGFLQQLCSMTAASVYCTTSRHFQADLKTPPVVQQLTFRARAGRPIELSFRLSKFSRVGIVVSRGASTTFLTSASFPYGIDGVPIPAQRAGSYTIALAATDLAGNFARVTGTLQVSR